jgi:hypothetical protein
MLERVCCNLICVCAGAQNAAISFLSIADTGLLCADAAVLIDVLVKFSGLNHFDISANPGLGGEGVAAILESLAGMQLHSSFFLASLSDCYVIVEPQ